MSGFYDELSRQIYSKDIFQRQYKDLFTDSVQKQLKKINNVRLIPTGKFDLKFLMEAAVIFAQSNNEKYCNIALRISQYVIEFVDHTVLKQAACMTLDILVNNQAIELAKNNENIPKYTQYSYPLKFSLDSLNREYEYSFHISEEDIVYCNKFQKEFIDGVENLSNIVSVSAPTSAGKSFIVRKWLKYNLELNNNHSVNLAIIVPTRALINQFEQDLKQELFEIKDRVGIVSMPFIKSKMTKKNKTIYIFTQERMSIFLSKNKSINFKTVFIDEAHKIGDNARGVLLQDVIDEIIRRNQKTKVVFAAPFAKNPEDIYTQASRIKSYTETVNRNYFHICRRSLPRKWKVIAELPDNTKSTIAKIDLNKSIPTGEYKILASWSYIIGKNDYGNLIYANGGGQAENIAEFIYDLESNTLLDDNKDINDLIELCQTIVHPDFLLIKLLKKRIAFHYGSMPQLIRQKIEELFNNKTLKYLICTSTLLEGVNLSCKNIFVRKPQKGNRQKMSGADLFNLLGRAGRLGKEFSGNIYYIDWNEAPIEKAEQIVERTTHNVLKNNFDEIINSFFDKLPEENVDNIEATVGYLFHNYLEFNNINNCQEVINICTNEQIETLNQILKKYSEKIKLPKEILENHPTTYHYSMQKLLERFQEKYEKNPDAIEEIIPKLTEEEMYTSLISILSRMQRYFNTGLFEPIYPALITTSWMRFKNLPHIIQKRIKYKEEKGIGESFNTSVRSVFNDIDEYARYKVPKLLSCYVDVMNYFFTQIDKNIPEGQTKDIAMFLEYGINKITQASMIVLGLSRSTIFELEKIKDKEGNILLNNDELSEEESLKWLSDNLEFIESSSKFPKLLVTEIKDTINSYN